MFGKRTKSYTKLFFSTIIELNRLPILMDSVRLSLQIDKNRSLLDFRLEFRNNEKLPMAIFSKR